MYFQKKASILLYTLFVTTFMIAFFAAFQNEIRSMLSRSAGVEEAFIGRFHLAWAYNQAATGNGWGSSEVYAIKKSNESSGWEWFFIGSGQTLTIPVNATSTGAIEFTAQNGFAPLGVTYTYTTPTSSTGFALDPGATVLLGDVSQSGTLSLVSLGGVSEVAIHPVALEILPKDTYYTVSREFGRQAEILGTFSVHK